MNDELTTIVYHCGAACDAAGVSLRDAAIAVRDGVIVEVGEAGKMAGDQVIDLSDRLIMPAMVNAHAHLNLTHIGPQLYGNDFVGWVTMIRSYGLDEESVVAGAKASEAAGVFAVGDICSNADEAGAMRGVSYVEHFGIGSPWIEQSLEKIATQHNHGIQPHAPYSAGPALFDAACASGLPASTHLAETHDEARFIARGDGPFLDLLRSIGKWDNAFADFYGQGLTPVQWMKPYLQRTRWLLAHCNYVNDDDINTLASSGASVAYCPLASEYFGHRDHRYRDMLDAGVNVCLGTDSIVCQPPPEVEKQPLGILSQMRRLHARDRVDPMQLLAMATTHGCRALGLDEAEATLAVGSPARLIAVQFNPKRDESPLTQVLRNRYPVKVIASQ